MKVSTLLISLILSLSNAAWAGPSDAEHKPMRGGEPKTITGIELADIVITTLPDARKLSEHLKGACKALIEVMKVKSLRQARDLRFDVLTKPTRRSR